MDAILHLVEWIWMALSEEKARRDRLATARARTVAEVHRVNAWLRTQPDAVTMPPKRADR